VSEPGGGNVCHPPGAGLSTWLKEHLMRHFKVLGCLALACGLLALAVAFFATPAAVTAAADEKERPDVHFVPTAQSVVKEMLKMAKVTKDDVVYDLGCGDGRIVITAAKEYGCKAKGFDIDPERIKECKENLDKAMKEKKGIDKLVSFEQKNIFKQDLSGATVVTLYLLPELNVKLVPQLKKLKAGSRIVSHAFNMRGYKPDRMVTIKAKDDEGKEREYDLYLWTTPLKPQKDED